MPGRERSDGGELENLTESVGHLADQLQIVGDSLDAIREDLNWLTRNPLRVEVDARVDRSAGRAENPLTVQDSTSEVDAAVSRLMKSLQEALATLSPEQLETIVETLDESHGHLLALMRGDVRRALHGCQTTASAIAASENGNGQGAGRGSSPPVPSLSPVRSKQPDRTAEPGRLF